VSVGRTINVYFSQPHGQSTRFAMQGRKAELAYDKVTLTSWDEGRVLDACMYISGVGGKLGRIDGERMMEVVKW
jgi:hypothetical protein